MSTVIRWQLQHGFHDERNFYSSYEKTQEGATSTCWVLGYATMVVHNYMKFKMCWMVWIK
jgi:hypothetical protein